MYHEMLSQFVVHLFGYSLQFQLSIMSHPKHKQPLWQDSSVYLKSENLMVTQKMIEKIFGSV